MAQTGTSLFGKIGRLLLWLLSIVALLLALALALLWWTMHQSRPLADGELALTGLSAPVTVERDANGVPTITADNRLDLARALGFLHAQERLFQMDTLRRLAAGELSELSGEATQSIDRRIRIHRFRARARAMVAAMPADEKALLDAYVAGVNAGRLSLGAAPYEYLITRTSPKPWTAEDSLLAVYAMYIDLQAATPQREMDRAIAEKAGGRALADLLFPMGSELDAPIDGSTLPLPVIPPATPAAPAAPKVDADLRLPEVVGSNNWAVGGALTASGGALVANDMHLGLNVPSIWYRARMVMRGAAPLDLTGVTLPGTPFLIAGSNGHVAWGYTNSYIDTSDAVIVEWTDEQAGRYRTPSGEAVVRRINEQLCIRRACEALPVVETIWGPIVGKDALGRTLAMRWMAHNGDAVRLGAALAMEQAADVPQAIALAHKAAMPQQNFTVGDSAGNIGWTIIGRVPRRIGFNGQDAVSFADGTRRWDGDLAPEETPTIINPAGSRIWTANSRVTGGEMHAKLGDGGYDNGARAGRIRDLLLARQQFAPADFLAIQLDDRATRNRFWQALMLDALQKARADPRLARLIPPVAQWGERAVPQATGYRMIDRFRRTIVEDVYNGYMGNPAAGSARRSYASGSSEGSMRLLLRERPAHLVPGNYKSWDALIANALDVVADDVDEKAGGDPARYLWGDVGQHGVSHPLARAIAPIGWLVNPENRAVPGDRPTVRAQAPGFGASERFAVTPGREAEGLFHMPGGNSGNPLAPWYLGGHEDWVEGRPTPFLPGKTVYRLVLKP